MHLIAGIRALFPFLEDGFAHNLPTLHGMMGLRCGQRVFLSGLFKLHSFEFKLLRTVLHPGITEKVNAQSIGNFTNAFPSVAEGNGNSAVWLTRLVQHRQFESIVYPHHIFLCYPVFPGIFRGNGHVVVPYSF